MTTPICDFVERYAASDTLRMHMPGHKGQNLLGFEALDITEIAGADSLFEADGIIAESERNASAVFGCPTFYSTEGSSLCIRAMLQLVTQHAGGRARILAGRNAHKAFLSAAALLDAEVRWIFTDESYLSCRPAAEEVNRLLLEAPADAVYLTSPDYLGNMADIQAISDVCHRHGALLLVDNAHGGYLKFLPKSMHPMDLGADLCCDSAHKTLPALTGAAYLHLSERLPDAFAQHAKSALALFGSTSPSYLTLQSLDALNALLASEYPARLTSVAERLQALRQTLSDGGWHLCGDEPMKLTFEAKKSGYTGTALASELRKRGIECEFADPDYLVLMPSPDSEAALPRLAETFADIEIRAAISDAPPTFSRPEGVMSVREAMLSPAMTVPADKAKGCVLASATVGCPPAVPIVVSGERIDDGALACFAYYGITSCLVVKREE